MFGGTAYAKGKPVTVTLSCTNAVGSATATVQLQRTIFGPAASNPLTLDCGTASVSGLSTNSQTLKATSLPSGYVSYNVSRARLRVGVPVQVFDRSRPPAIPVSR